ncbi:MAG: helix-turn-helix domain-containing protein [Thermoanaerobaculia bacterium]
MGLIKNDRQLAITRKTLEGLTKVLEKLRAKYRGADYRLTSSGPKGMIEQLEDEIREYEWLKRATPEQVMKRYPVVKFQDVGPFLARIRIASGMTQEEIARKVGCKQPDIARLEDADYQSHSARALKSVAEALGVEIMIGARKAGRPKRVG